MIRLQRITVNPLLLLAVAHIEDADSDWLITLRCAP